jgi:hypothetical protein
MPEHSKRRADCQYIPLSIDCTPPIMYNLATTKKTATAQELRSRATAYAHSGGPRHEH